jgi:hypothetical protein
MYWNFMLTAAGSQLFRNTLLKTATAQQEKDKQSNSIL